jgi:isoquinoline 1-oxidoreductase subunit beta
MRTPGLQGRRFPRRPRTKGAVTQARRSPQSASLIGLRVSRHLHDAADRRLRRQRRAYAAAPPTSQLISVIVNRDGTVSFDLPCAEVEQGITTAIAMTIAEELDVALRAVRVTLADARPELVFNQLTAGSNSAHSMFTPVRLASVIARARLLVAAAQRLGVPQSRLSVREGVVTGPGAVSVSYGELAARAAASKTTRVPTLLKPRSSFKVVEHRGAASTPARSSPGRSASQWTTMSPARWRAMLCRPPTINGSV